MIMIFPSKFVNLQRRLNRQCERGAPMETFFVLNLWLEANPPGGDASSGRVKNKIKSYVGMVTLSQVITDDILDATTLRRLFPHTKN